MTSPQTDWGPTSIGVQLKRIVQKNYHHWLILSSSTTNSGTRAHEVSLQLQCLRICRIYLTIGWDKLKRKRITARLDYSITSTIQFVTSTQVSDSQTLTNTLKLLPTCCLGRLTTQIMQEVNYQNTGIEDIDSITLRNPSAPIRKVFM